MRLICTKISSFSCIFRENWSNNRLAPPLWLVPCDMNFSMLIDHCCCSFGVLSSRVFSSSFLGPVTGNLGNRVCVGVFEFHSVMVFVVSHLVRPCLHLHTNTV